MTRRDNCVVCEDRVEDCAPSCQKCGESFCIDCIDAHVLNVTPEKLSKMYDLYENFCREDTPEKVETAEFFEEFLYEYCIMSNKKDNELSNLKVENDALKKENSKLKKEITKIKTENKKLNTILADNKI